MTPEQRVRSEHPDWTDEQVAAEVARLAAQPPADPPADPPSGQDNAAFARLRREKEEADRRAKAAQDALAAKERQEAEEQGRWKELAESAQAESEALKKRIAEGEQRRSVEAAARALNFRDPDIVEHLLPASVDRNDTEAVKAALTTVATERPHLVSTPAPPPPSGGPAGGGGPQDPPKLTREQLAAMSPKQVAALDPKVLNDALAG